MRDDNNNFCELCTRKQISACRVVLMHCLKVLAFTMPAKTVEPQLLVTYVNRLSQQRQLNLSSLAPDSVSRTVDEEAHELLARALRHAQACSPTYRICCCRSS